MDYVNGVPVVMVRFPNSAVPGIIGSAQVSGYLAVGKTAAPGNAFYPLLIDATGSLLVTAAVAGTVTANQGTRGTEAWPVKDPPPLAAVVAIASQVLPLAAPPAPGAWVTSAATAIQNAAAQQGYNHLRLGINLSVPDALGNVVEVMVETSAESPAPVTWQEAEDAIDLTGVPVAGVLLAPRYARHSTLALAAGSTMSDAWNIEVSGCTFYRVSVREAGTSPAGANGATCAVNVAQFRG